MDGVLPLGKVWFVICGWAAFTYLDVLMLPFSIRIPRGSRRTQRRLWQFSQPCQGPFITRTIPGAEERSELLHTEDELRASSHLPCFFVTCSSMFHLLNIGFSHFLPLLTLLLLNIPSWIISSVLYPPEHRGRNGITRWDWGTFISGGWWFCLIWKSEWGRDVIYEKTLPSVAQTVFFFFRLTIKKKLNSANTCTQHLSRFRADFAIRMLFSVLSPLKAASPILTLRCLQFSFWGR